MAPLLAVCSRRASDQDGGGAAIEVQDAPAPSPEGLPSPPFALAPPLSLAETGALADRPGIGPRVLFASARVSLRRGELRAAVRDANASVAMGGRGHLLLARAHARLAEVSASLYWLQRGALEEGADPRAIDDEDDLAPVREDPRWPELRSFLGRASSYWAASGRRSVVLIAPERVPRARALPLVLALHDDGDEPADFLDEESHRRRAPRFGVIFAGVSGAIPLGPLTYRWSTVPDENLRHLRWALGEVQKRARTLEGDVILLGFSEGAQAALETAGLDPERYRGAIALSPRSLGELIAPIPPHPAVARQRYVITSVTFDSIDAVGTAYIDTDRLRGLGAAVKTHEAWFYGTHALPPDYELQLPRWVDYLLRRR